MSKICEVCGKKPVFGHKVSHAHNVSSRRWLPNLQTVRTKVKGATKRVTLCVSCLKAGKVTKQTRRPATTA